MDCVNTSSIANFVVLTSKAFVDFRMDDIASTKYLLIKVSTCR